MRSFRASSSLILTLAGTAAYCGACSIVEAYSPISVGTNFRAKVANHGRPVGSLRIKLTSIKSNGNDTFTETDPNGFAVFRNVRPGPYRLSADHDSGLGGGAQIEVKVDGRSDAMIPLEWPQGASFVVRSLRGTIRSSELFPGPSQPALSLELLEAVSGRSLKTSQTTERGQFDFGSTSPGLYFVRLKPFPGGDAAGLISVTVDSGAAKDQLEIDFGWTTCGVWFVDQNRCPQADLRFSQLSGQIVDGAGAVIPNAGILLVDSAGAVVEQLRSDFAGRFTSPQPLAGTYELVVSMAGFSPLRRSVHAEAASDSAPRSVLRVELGVSGNCSTVSQQQLEVANH